MIVCLCLVASRLAAAKGGLPSVPQDQEWRLLGNGNDQQFFSPLAQINDKTIKNLGLVWFADIPAQDGLVGNPLIADGVIYQSGPLSRIYAHDLRSGKLLWRFDPGVSLEGSTMAAYFGARFNRGVALWENKVIVATGDCRVVAVERATGKKIWDSVSCDRKQLYTITAAPRVGGGKVFIGNACADSGVGRGFVDALDVETGKRVWRFYTVPGPPTPQGYENEAMKMAAKTWGSGEWWKKSQGCGSAWEGITYDPQTNLVYFGVDGPAPWNPVARSSDAGDELFTNSILAVNADSGAYVWHYKTTPHDAWNLDATMQIAVADLPVGTGDVRHVVMTAPKNGFFYVLDARTGAFLSAGAFAPQNWAKRIDQKTGRPIPSREAMYWKNPDGSAVVLPGPNGAHNWEPMAFSPRTGLIYIPTIIIPTLLKVDPQVSLGGVSMDAYYSLSGDPKWPAYGELVAWDPRVQMSRWRVRHRMPINGGAVATGGNLVFEGDAEGNFTAYRADTGERMWSANVGESIAAAPAIVQIDGQQVIVVPAGNSGSAVLGRFMAKYSSTATTRGPSRLLAFKLGGTATLPVVPEILVARPPRPKQPAELARKGAVLFEQSYCADCHGSRAEGASGSVPDLRNSVAGTHERFEAIVMGGLLHNMGMPAFPDLSLADTQAIHAYLINQAWADYEAQQARKQPH